LQRALTYAILGIWTVVCLFPLYWIAVTSLKDEYAVAKGPFYLPLIDFEPTLAGWNSIFTDREDNLASRYLNSIGIALISTAFTVLFGAMASYGLTRFAFGKVFSAGNILFVFLASRILPPVVLAQTLYMMAQATGTLDSWIVLIIVYTTINLPVAIWLLQGVFGQTASEQEDAAVMEGASHARIFFTIIMPMSASGLATIALLTFVLCWNEYLFASVLVSDHALTVPPWLVGQISFKEAQIIAEGDELSHLSVAILLTVAPLLAIAGVVQRFPGRLRMVQT
jgi:multiple sugar transport system permease protein